MLVIPAVDIKGGNCVRLIQGDASRETIYSDDPLAMAKQWEKQGAERLHVVDLDGAFAGQMKNTKIILNIARELNIPVQVGGGIRDSETAEILLQGGVYKIIIGTSAIWDIGLMTELLKKWPDRVSVDIASKNNRIADRGWIETTSETPDEHAREMRNIGVREIIVTDVKKDGTRKGPNLDLVKRIAYRVDISVIASGGVSSIEDIKKLKELNLPNLTGVIVGKALYSSDVVLSEAIKAAQNGG